MDQDDKTPQVVDGQTMAIPVLPLRDVVVYPHMVLPLFVGREKSIEALEDAMANDKQVLLVAQRHAADDNPGADDIYQVGTVSNILQLLKLPDGTITDVERTELVAARRLHESNPMIGTRGVRRAAFACGRQRPDSLRTARPGDADPRIPARVRVGSGRRPLPRRWHSAFPDIVRSAPRRSYR